MSAVHARHPADRPATPRAEQQRRRADLDHDVVAVAAMLAILALTALCLVGQRFLPL